MKIKINPIIIACALLINLSMAAPSSTNEQLPGKLILINHNDPIADNFSVYEIQTNYWLVNGQGEVNIKITTLDHLLITAYLYDVNGHEKAQAATFINNRTKMLTLPLDNFTAGDYQLIIKALATNHQSAEKTYAITLTNITGEDDSA